MALNWGCEGKMIEEADVDKHATIVVPLIEHLCEHFKCSFNALQVVLSLKIIVQSIFMCLTNRFI